MIKKTILALSGVAALAAVPAGFAVADGGSNPAGSGAAQALAAPASESPRAPDGLTARLIDRAAASKRSPIAITKTAGFITATGTGVVGSGSNAEGVAYTCIELPEGNGGCAASAEIGEKEPFGSVTVLGEGKYAVTVLLPVDTVEARVVGEQGQSSSLAVTRGAASGVVAGGSAAVQTLSWTSASGEVSTHSLVTP